MSFLGNLSLTRLLKLNNAIDPYNEENIKNGAYELSLGEQVFQSDSKPRAIKNLYKGELVTISPGQFALLLTEETIAIPENKIAFISIKASIKFKGLVNVSGFHVDPGFKGKLLFSVYNAGPSTIVLKQGERYFPMWLAELNESQDYKGSHDNQKSIPKDPIEALSQGDLASPSSLLELIKDKTKELDSKIAVLERGQTANDYLLKTGIGIFIVILLKIGLDFFGYQLGMSKGEEKKNTEIKLDSTINHLLEDKKVLQIEIDSLERLKNGLNSKN